MTKLEEAVAHHRAGRLDQAKAAYRRLLDENPGHFDALHLLGVVAAQESDPALALELMDRAIAIDARNSACFRNRGLALLQLGRLDAAIASFETAAALDPASVEAHLDLARSQQMASRFAPAAASYERVLALRPDHTAALLNRGVALAALQRYEEALASYDRMIALKPASAKAWSNRGHVLLELGQPEQALDSIEQALALDPAVAEIHGNRANVLRALGRTAEALASCERALELDPESATLLRSRAEALEALDRFGEALESLRRARDLQPGCELLAGSIVHARLDLCDWGDIDADLRDLARRVEAGEMAAIPFTMLAAFDDPALHRKAAETYARRKRPASDALGPAPRRSDGGRIRIGYFSPDFRRHAVAYLTAELFEAHDRARFEVTGFSYGPPADDDFRTRIASAFERFVDVRGDSDREVAALARNLGIDIAVDLGGYTQHARPGILALRAAPVQASYIGYLGTMAAPYYDYLVADPVIIPAASREHYAERIAYLPSYQANDSRRLISPRLFTRGDLGLPAEGFVFACLNNAYKILPETFGRWMQILRQVEGSVLFLNAPLDAARENLRSEARRAGIDPGRLHFAEMIPRDEYIARFRALDLFLDTLPYNAGTVASDALWAGLPVLTLAGESFAGRMGASLLTALGMPELIARTPAEYVERACELARSRETMPALRAKLAAQRRTQRLFDTPRFTRDLERLYEAMHARALAGLPPQDLPAGT